MNRLRLFARTVIGYYDCVAACYRRRNTLYVEFYFSSFDWLTSQGIGAMTTPTPFLADLAPMIQMRIKTKSIKKTKAANRLRALLYSKGGIH